MYHKCVGGSGGFALNLGQITSYNVSSLYSDYNNLTINNFVIVPISSSNGSNNMDINTSMRGTSGSFGCGYSIGSCSYNAQNGLLTVSAPYSSGSYVANRSNGEGLYDTVSGSCIGSISYNVWLVVHKAD